MRRIQANPTLVTMEDNNDRSSITMKERLEGGVTTTVPQEGGVTTDVPQEGGVTAAVLQEQGVSPKYEVISNGASPSGEVGSGIGLTVRRVTSAITSGDPCDGHAGETVQKSVEVTNGHTYNGTEEAVTDVTMSTSAIQRDNGALITLNDAARSSQGRTTAAADDDEGYVLHESSSEIGFGELIIVEEDAEFAQIGSDVTNGAGGDAPVENIAPKAVIPAYPGGEFMNYGANSVVQHQQLPTGQGHLLTSTSQLVTMPYWSLQAANNPSIQYASTSAHHVTPAALPYHQGGAINTYRSNCLTPVSTSAEPHPLSLLRTIQPTQQNAAATSVMTSRQQITVQERSAVEALLSLDRKRASATTPRSNGYVPAKRGRPCKDASGIPQRRLPYAKRGRNGYASPIPIPEADRDQRFRVITEEHTGRAGAAPEGVWTLLPLRIGERFGPVTGEFKPVKDSKGNERVRFINTDKTLPWYRWMEYMHVSDGPDANILAVEDGGKIVFECIKDIQAHIQVVASRPKTTEQMQSATSVIFPSSIGKYSNIVPITPERDSKTMLQIPSQSLSMSGGGISKVMTNSEFVTDDKTRNVCEHCDLQFSDASNLQRHIRTVHTSLRQHQCSVCGKSFGTLSGLKQHQHIHSTNKPFQCEVCLKSYTQFSNLCRHKRMHSDCRQLNKCRDCNQAFSTITSLNKHRRFCEGCSQKSPAPAITNGSPTSMATPLYPTSFQNLPTSTPDNKMASTMHPSVVQAYMIQQQAQQQQQQQAQQQQHQQAQQQQHQQRFRNGMNAFPAAYQAALLTHQSLYPDIKYQDIKYHTALMSALLASGQSVFPGTTGDSSETSERSHHTTESVTSGDECNGFTPKPSTPIFPEQQALPSNIPRVLNENNNNNNEESKSWPYMVNVKKEVTEPSSPSRSEVKHDVYKPVVHAMYRPFDDKTSTSTHSTSASVNDGINEPLDLSMKSCKKAAIFSPGNEAELNHPVSNHTPNNTSLHYAFPTPSYSNPGAADSRHFSPVFPPSSIATASLPQSTAMRSLLHSHAMFPERSFPMPSYRNTSPLLKNEDGCDSPIKGRYTCQYCQKIFPRTANLTRHLRTHTGEQPYQCGFSISSNLQRHVRNIHNREKPYKCEKCSRAFSQQTNLERHLRKHECSLPDTKADEELTANGTISRQEEYYRRIDKFLDDPVVASNLEDPAPLVLPRRVGDTEGVHFRESDDEMDVEDSLTPDEEDDEDMEDDDEEISITGSIASDPIREKDSDTPVFPQAIPLIANSYPIPHGAHNHTSNERGDGSVPSDVASEAVEKVLLKRSHTNDDANELDVDV